MAYTAVQKQFPNPFHSTITLHYSSPQHRTVQLINAMGKEVFMPPVVQGEMEELVITNDLPSGIYFLKISEREKNLV